MTEQDENIRQAVYTLCAKKFWLFRFRYSLSVIFRLKIEVIVTNMQLINRAGNQLKCDEIIAEFFAIEEFKDISVSSRVKQFMIANRMTEDIEFEKEVYLTLEEHRNEK